MYYIPTPIYLRNNAGYTYLDSTDAFLSHRAVSYSID